MLDDKIINECLEGSRVAQEKVYNFYAARMRGICLRYAASVFEAEDIFQEGFVEVFTNLKNYRGQGSFDGWVRRIIVFTAIDHYKKNLRYQSNVHYEVLDNYDIGTVEPDEDLGEEDMLNILNKLPDGYRIVFNLYAIEGFSHKEISEMLQISEGTSKSQLSKARRLIQQMLYQKTNLTSNEKGS